MNETTRHGTEFFWRRLEEQPELFGQSLGFDPMWWLGVGLLVLLLSLLLVYRLYIRDGQAVGWFWGSFLSLLRTLTLVSLFFIWLLPAIREVEWTEQRSRVLLLFDTSASMQSSDAPVSESPGQVRPTRQEMLLGFLHPTATPSEGAGDLDFLGRLLAKNPLHCYRFGEQLDEKDWSFPFGDADSKLHQTFPWDRKLQPALRPGFAEPLFVETLDEFHKAADRLKRTEQLEGEARDRQRAQIAEELDKAVAEDQQLRERLLNRTNLGESLLRVLRKESGNMVQGVIIFSDGHQNAGSSQDIQEAAALAKKAGIPLITVGIGEHRETFNLRLADVLAPSQVQPEDEFPVRVAVEGENLQGQQEVEVILNIERPDQQKAEPMKQKLVLTETTPGRSGGTAEFRIKNPDKEKIKDGTWKFRGRVTAIKGERARGDNLSEEPAIVKVTERKPSVLLFAAGPTREYQFLRTLLVREREKFDLSIHLQVAEGAIVQDVDPKRLLAEFPTNLRDRDGDPMNLGNYDVVVAFDPDWRLVPAKVRQNVQKWVEDFSGGLVVIAGPVHTFTLARDKELTAIQELFPVELDASATSFTVMDRPNKEPWALNWGPTAAQQTFLDLKDAGDKTKALEGWEEFFGARRNPTTGLAEGPAERGFFSFFPVAGGKPNANILARFSDNVFTQKGGERHPYFAMHTVKKGQVFYIGSGESWRLRQYEEKFHERFWTKLVRHMGRGDQSRASRRGLLIVGSRYAEGDNVEVEAQLYDAEMQPLQPDPKSKILLKVVPPEGTSDTPPEWAQGLEMKPGRPGWFSARFQVRRVGKYNLQIGIPGSLETLAGGFRVESVDAERDQTRPDFALLHRLAGEARSVRLIDEKKRPDFLKAVGRSKESIKMVAGAESSKPRSDSPGLRLSPDQPGAPTAETEEDRLFFTLKEASWIPECLDANVVPFRAEGKVTDLWDKGWTVFANIHEPERAAGPPWALVLIATLLGLEWLTRKLLRLA